MDTVSQSCLVDYLVLKDVVVVVVVVEVKVEGHGPLHPPIRMTSQFPWCTSVPGYIMLSG